MLTSAHVVARSNNSKTGEIPVTYRPMTTCPGDCPFLPTGDIGGCYGTGRIFGMADKYSGDVDQDRLDAVLSKVRAGARYLRDRVVGDVLTPDGRVDHNYIGTIAEAAARHGLRPFGYTHAWRRFKAVDVDAIAASGYVMNASCETPADVAEAVDLGMPAVITNDDIPEGTMISGRRVVTCPAQTRDDVTCASCGLCAKPQRKSIVRFLIHGTARNKARAAVRSR